MADHQEATVANPVLMRLSRSDRVKRLTTSLPVTRSVVDRFIAGETDAEVLGVIRRLREQGLTVTIDRLGEDVADRAQADSATGAYVALLGRLAEQGMVPAAEVSVKLSAIGGALGSDGTAIALANAHAICQAAADAGTTVSIDMEDHTTVDATLGAVRQLREDFPWVAAVVQAALRRTAADLADLVGPGSRIRLVKGAYDEPPSVAFTEKADVSAAYDRCLQILLAAPGYPQIATHDLGLVERARELAAQHARNRDSYEFQLLYGVRPALQSRLCAQDQQVRIYVPFGSDWYGYFMRRLAERPANVGFFARALVGH